MPEDLGEVGLRSTYSESTTNNSAKALEQYYRRLHTVTDHMFVTPESRTLRGEASDFLTTLKQRVSAHGISPDIAMYIYGSVGVGLAKAESDVDCKIVYDCKEVLLPDNTMDAVEYELKKMNLNKFFIQYQNLESLITLSLERPFTKNLLSLSAQPADMRSSLFLLRKGGELFGPALNEFSDPQEQRMVNRWRKQFLTELVSRYPLNSQFLWDHIRAYLKKTYVRYEDQKTSEETEEEAALRPARVAEVIGSTISQRFPDNSEAQSRAHSFIESSRAAFEFPELSEMLLAFGVPDKK